MPNTLKVCSFAHYPSRLKWVLDVPTIIPIAEVTRVGLLKGDAHQANWREAMKRGGFFCSAAYPNHKMVEGAERWAPRYLVTEYISEPATLKFLLPLLKEAHLHVQDEIVVCCARPEVALRVPEEYAIGVSGKETHDVFDPWYLTGRRVWIVSGPPKRQWRRFCEHMVTGAHVEGVVLSDYDWFKPATRGEAIGKTPYLVGDVGLPQTDAIRQTLHNLVGFWRQVDGIIGR